MTWRDKARPEGAASSEHELPLETVLDYYGVRHTSRLKQMVSCPIQVDDSRPSMSIDLDKQLWKCHSCGKGGDVWVLIQEKEGIADFGGARQFAEATFGVAGSDIGRGARDVRGCSRRERQGRTVSSRSGNGPVGREYKPSWRRN